MSGSLDSKASDLEIVTWTANAVTDSHTSLSVAHGPLLVDVHGVDAIGLALVSNGSIGADLIRLSAGARFAPHTHPGYHILTVVGGIGTIPYDGKIVKIEASQTYHIEGEIPYAVGAITDRLIIAVGSLHKAIVAEDRMAPVPYEEVIADTGDVTCIICQKSTLAPDRLHHARCPHCPCLECVGGGR